MKNIHPWKKPLSFNIPKIETSPITNFLESTLLSFTPMSLLSSLAVLTPCLAILHGWLVPSIRGSFSCNDTSIQFSYTGDTVSTKLLLCATLFPVLVLLLLVEASNLPRLGWSRVTGLAASNAGSIFLR